MFKIKSEPFREHRSRKRWIVVVIVLMTVSCTPQTNDSLADHSFVTGQPCAPPCWYGLEVNKSDEKEVYATISGQPFVDQSTIHETQSAWLGDPNAKEILYGCLHPKDASCGGAQFAKDKLKMLWMSVGYELTFKAVVDQLGPPDYIDYGPYSPEGGCQVELSWLKKGIAVHSLDANSDLPCELIKDNNGVRSDSRVNTIIYSVREVLESGPGGCCQRVPWRGFAQP
jgi:hypothetical protein